MNRAVTLLILLVLCSLSACSDRHPEAAPHTVSSTVNASTTGTGKADTANPSDAADSSGSGNTLPAGHPPAAPSRSWLPR